MTLRNLFIEAAQKTPDAPAVSGPDGTRTYGEIDRTSNQAARVLSGLGVGPGDRVGLWYPKNTRVVTMMQAVLKTGAAYVPLDPGSPPERIEKIIADCDFKVVVTGAAGAGRLSTRAGTTFFSLDNDLGAGCFDDLEDVEDGPYPSPEVQPRDLAYILYTSGSTGTPKGVCISHENALAFIRWAKDSIDARPEDRFSNHAPFHFDLSVFDIYVPALVGAHVSIIPEGISYIPKRLVHFLQTEKISVWYSVPSALIMMMEHGELKDIPPEAHPRVVVFAGEPYPIGHLRKLRAAFEKSRLWNYYGPTETNVCTAYEVGAIQDDAVAIPIGGPASSDRTWVVREDGGIAETGDEGELLVQGPTVMLGYWGRPPHHGAYPTGDIVKVRSDGGYDYVGRRDHMVKIRGFRVELGEVEAALESHDRIERAAAMVVGSGIDANLVAFLSGTAGDKPTIIELKQFIAQRLPRYMIVDRVTWLDQLPRTANGKLDRRHLREMARKPQGEDADAA